MTISFYKTTKKSIPEKNEDYSGIDTFSKIHLKQNSSNINQKKQIESDELKLKADKAGKVNYDITILENIRKGKKVYATANELEKIIISEDKLLRPSKEETKKLLQKVRSNLEEKLNGRLNTVQARIHHQKKFDQPVFVKYRPINQIEQNDSCPKSRIIKIHQMAKDPLEPPKFYHKKLPVKPPSPPVPIMHSPLRIITYEDQKNWKIPPCISNWKNNKGFAIPLHQRLATTGKGLTDTPINDRFASMAEALYLAERLAREQVESRAMERRKRTEQIRKEREKKLRRIAKETREDVYKMEDREIETPIPNMIIQNSSLKQKITKIKTNSLTREDIEAQNEREQLREEARRQRKRQMGLEKARGIITFKERDISEQIALGQRLNENKGEVMFDQRLFNRDSGISNQLGSDELYSVYDKPMNMIGEKHVYKPKKIDDLVSKYAKLDELINSGLKFKSHSSQTKIGVNLETVQFRKVKLFDLDSKSFSGKKIDKVNEKKKNKKM